MKLLPIALVLAGTTGLAGLAFTAGPVTAERALAMPAVSATRDHLSSLHLADFSYDDDEDEGEDDDDEGGDEDDDSATFFAPVICLTGNATGDDDDDDDGTPVCDPAGQTAAGPSAVVPDPNRAAIFNSAPTAVVN